MSEVKADNLDLIESPDDVWPLYEGAGAEMKTGVEVELCYFDPQSPDLAPMTPEQNAAVKKAANDAMGRADWFRNEPTADVLEVGTFACPADSTCLKNIIDDNNRKISLLSAKARDIGLKRSYFPAFPEKTSPELFKGLVDNPRFQAFFNPPRTDMIDVAAYFAVCKSNQVSVSYHDLDHLLTNIRRLYVLTPFLFMLTDNSSPFDQGKPFPGHAGMTHRTSLGARGNVPPYLFTAASGEDYITAHINHVMNGPLFVFYDRSGVLQRIPSGQWKSFTELKADGLNTASNYFLAQSVLWPDVKIAPYKDGHANPVGHRYEARGIGVGIHQHQSALLIVAGLAFKDSFAARTDELLNAFGFDLGRPGSLKEPLDKAYEAARTHNHQFLNTRYGNGTMRNFASRFADILEDVFAGEGLDEELVPLLDICRSGLSDAHINYKMWPGLDDCLKHQKEYDDRIFENPNQNARMVFGAA